MLLTLSEMYSDVSPEQPSKAESSMLFTLSGMCIDVRPVQPEKAESPMLVTSCRIIVFLQPSISVFYDVSMMALQSCLESYFWLLFATVIDFSPVHSSKE